MPGKLRKPKHPDDEKIYSERRDLQSFFFIGSFPELIIFTILMILIISYFSVFSADGVVFTNVFKDVEDKETVPDKKQVIAKIEEVKTRNGAYPYDLSQLGLSKKYGSTRIDYAANGDEFELCYTYFPYIANSSSCYYSKVGEWDQ